MLKGSGGRRNLQYSRINHDGFVFLILSTPVVSGDVETSLKLQNNETPISSPDPNERTLNSKLKTPPSALMSQVFNHAKTFRKGSPIHYLKHT